MRTAAALAPLREEPRESLRWLEDSSFVSVSSAGQSTCRRAPAFLGMALSEKTDNARSVPTFLGLRKAYKNLGTDLENCT